MAQQKEVIYDYESIDPGYYDHVFRRNAGIQSKWHHLKFAHVRAQMPQDYDRHLDIGCGPGTFIGTLDDEARSIGVDLAEPQIQYARREYQTDMHEFSCVAAGKLEFDDDTFGVVTMVELIEHLALDVIEQVFAEARRVLIPGGKLIVTTPNYGSLWPLLEKIVNARAEVTYEDQHITFFKRKPLRDLLERTGFSRCASVTFQGGAPFLAALHWKLADAVQIIENPLLSHGMGFLLLGTGYKP